jgi:hypothetical protein
MKRGGLGARLFVTVWLVYAVHLTTNVVRETYLAVALGERLSLRVDPYLGLHPDLFVIDGRGAYVDGNPGASILGAVPYALARPFIAGLFALRPELGRPKPPTTYDDPRPNRTRFMNEMRARGLDVRLALAAFATQLGLMAPLGALAALAVYQFLRRRLGDENRALGLALLYAFATPLFFRSAFLNQNALLAHAVLLAWVTVGWPGTMDPGERDRRWIGAGALLGFGLVCDYSAAPLAVIFGSWALWEGWSTGGMWPALRRGAACMLGAAGPIALLLGYQWAAFGSPWFPAQHYMPATEFSVRGWNGITLPSLELLWQNLFDLRFGLFAFCPLLLAALAAPFVRRDPKTLLSHELVFALLGAGALWIFSSSIQFAHLQFNTGVRYMVPAVPLLFFALVPVLLAMPRWVAWALIAPTVLISWAVSMTREDVPTALRMVFSGGPSLPVLTVLQKTAAAYAPSLAAGGALLPLAVYALLGLLLWLIWRSQLPALATNRRSR